tara:strand:+ start:30 stop:476 length:447 start_codon:yes stop_codon:yes gene_type:complete
MNLKFSNKLLGTFFYIGMSPIAPGTVASLVAGILWFNFPNKLYLQVSIIIITLSVGIYLSMNIFKSKADKDPRIFVLDEIVGMWISLLMLPKHLGIYVLAFLLFRFFDILKPSIISHIDRSSNYYSIMLDDVCAGIFTLIICCQIVTI